MSSAQRIAVWNGERAQTTGGLKKADLIKNRHGRIVSKKKSEVARKLNNLGNFLASKGAKAAKAKAEPEKPKPKPKPVEKPKPETEAQAEAQAEAQVEAGRAAEAGRTGEAEGCADRQANEDASATVQACEGGQGAQERAQ